MTVVFPPEALDGFDEAALRVLRDRDPGLHWRSLRDDGNRVDEDTSAPSDDHSVEPATLTVRLPH